MFLVCNLYVQIGADAGSELGKIILTDLNFLSVGDTHFDLWELCRWNMLLLSDELGEMLKQ